VSIVFVGRLSLKSYLYTFPVIAAIVGSFSARYTAFSK